MEGRNKGTCLGGADSPRRFLTKERQLTNSNPDKVKTRRRTALRKRFRETSLKKILKSQQFQTNFRAGLIRK